LIDKNKNMIIDKRKQKRLIIIKVENDYNRNRFDIDDLIEELSMEIEIICRQRKLPDGAEIEITLE
jgi:hypothetical protein